MIRSQNCLSQEVCKHLLLSWVTYFRGPGDLATCRFLPHCLSGFVCLFVLFMLFLLKVKLLKLALELLWLLCRFLVYYHFGMLWCSVMFIIHSALGFGTLVLLQALGLQRATSAPPLASNASGSVSFL